MLTCTPVLSLPEWLPGSVLRRKAAISKDCAVRMIAEPFEYARKREVRFVPIQRLGQGSLEAGCGQQSIINGARSFEEYQRRR